MLNECSDDRHKNSRRIAELSDIPPQTRRVLSAKAEVDAAWQALAPAAANGTPAELEAARARYKAAEDALANAMRDASRRSRTSRGNARRDASYTPEQEAMREQIFERFALSAPLVETPSIDVLARANIAIKPWTAEILAAWANACGTLGSSTVARWFLIGALLQIGPPPGYEGKWPPGDP